MDFDSEDIEAYQTIQSTLEVIIPIVTVAEICDTPSEQSLVLQSMTSKTLSKCMTPEFDKETPLQKSLTNPHTDMAANHHNLSSFMGNNSTSQ